MTQRALITVFVFLLSAFALGQRDPIALLPYYPVTNQHVEIAADYSLGAGWSTGEYDSDNDELVVPSGRAWNYASANARVTWPTGSQWSFFAAPGQQVWVMPQVQDVTLPYLGFSTEGLPGNYFDSYFNTDPRVNRTGRWIKLQVLSVSGPGQFAVWQTDGFGQPIAWVSTKDGLGASDVMWSLEGGHTHFNWGFTSPGKYQAVVQVSAVKGGQTVTSSLYRLSFGIEQWWWQFNPGKQPIFP